MTRLRRRAIQGATIREVAVLAGGSPMTVSRVINSADHVRNETRELVTAANRELNYTPSPAARSLAGSAPYRIGLLYDNPSTGYLGEFLVGTLDESSRTGAPHQLLHPYTLIVRESSGPAPGNWPERATLSQGARRMLRELMVALSF